MEWTTLAVAGMSLIGTLAGTFGGILVANKLTTYRIEQLERKVSEHNKVVERTYKLEGRMTAAEHDIRDLKGAAYALPHGKPETGGMDMEQLYGRLAALLAVKSLVTLALTAVFVCLALRGTVSGGDFLTVFLMVISFYFGTQNQRRSGEKP